jgi:hypothetical protein
MYLVFSTGNADNNNVTYWLDAIDIRTGSPVKPVAVSASVTRSDGAKVSFTGGIQAAHPSLLLDSGSVYLAFGSDAGKEGSSNYHGWVMRYRSTDLSLQSVFCTCKDWTRRSPCLPDAVRRRS